MGEPTILRPDMLQTYIPFVEMYINGVDILRTHDGKPRALIGFSHEVVAGSGWLWTIEVFDANFVAIEEVLFAVRNVPEATEVAEETFGELDTEIKKEEVLSGAMFRYGYMNPEGKILSVAPTGEDFYFGNVHAYVPNYQPHGTYLTIRGDSSGGGVYKKAVLHETVYRNMTYYQILKRVCKQQDWEFVPIRLDVEDLPEEQIPIAIPATSWSVDSTEEDNPVIKLREKENPLDFLNRIWLDVRPKHRYYGGYMFYLEYKTKAKFTDETGAVAVNPKGYLYFGPKDLVGQEPVRKYVYLRDPNSDVISFTPSIDAYTLIKGGAGGLTWKCDNAATGEMSIHYLDETSRTQKYFRNERPPVAISMRDLGLLQVGTPEFDDGDENKSEGVNEGQMVLATVDAPDPDVPWLEYSTSTTMRTKADFEMLNYWITMHDYINTATLEIFGDPSPDLTPSKLISVYLYVPDAEGNLTELHWISSIWTILGISHQIQGGSYTTTLNLSRAAFTSGSVQSKAFYRAALKDLSGQASE